MGFLPLAPGTVVVQILLLLNCLFLWAGDEMFRSESLVHIYSYFSIQRSQHKQHTCALLSKTAAVSEELLSHHTAARSLV